MQRCGRREWGTPALMQFLPHDGPCTKAVPCQLCLVMQSAVLPAASHRAHVTLAHLCDIGVPLQPQRLDKAGRHLIPCHIWVRCHVRIVIPNCARHLAEVLYPRDLRMQQDQ